MAYNRPTLEELIQRITSDLETSLGIVGASLRKSFTKLFSKVIAGAAHLLHGHLDWNAKQLFPDTAEGENLTRWASIWGITRKAGVFAEGSVTFTGTNGIEIPEETELTSSDGILYETTEAGTIASGEIEVDVICKTAGEDGNSAVDTVLTLTTPISEVDTEATVTVALTGGVDQESDADLLDRLLDRIQTPPLGGAEQDYVQWAKENDGVTRAWCYPLYLGAGTVGVFFVKDASDPIIPTDEDIETVSAYIEERRPVTSRHYVFAPTADPISFEIHLNPDTEAIRYNVEQELQDMIERDAEPGGTILLSHMREAISIATDENDNVLISPTADFESSTGYIATFGDITWT